MALVPEDGTGLPSATTVATRQELIDFALARGVTVPSADATDVNLILAMDFLWTLEYVGTLVNADQGTPFPRVYNEFCTNVPVFPADSVPAGFKKAQLLLALASFQGVKLLNQASAGRAVKSRDVGPMKRTYSDSERDTAFIAGLDGLLEPYLLEGGGFNLTTKRA